MKCGILRRFALGAGTLLLFGFTLTPGAQQNQSSPQAHPPRVSETLAEAQSSLGRGNAAEAIQILSSYLQTRPKDSAARTLLGQAYASIGQNERAEEELQRVLQIAPNDSTALAALGEIYEREGQPKRPSPCWRMPRKVSAATRGSGWSGRQFSRASTSTRKHKAHWQAYPRRVDMKSASGSTG